ncbi:7TM domain-containing protein [Patescibacteria group bacterium]
MNFDSILATNFFQQSLDQAVAAGIPESYLAYFFLVPILASLIAAARHLIGFTVHGIFLPAILAVVWQSFGLGGALAISLFLYLWARMSRFIIRKTMIRRFRIDYLPRMAILLLFVSLGGVALILVGKTSFLLTLKENLFVVLILILLIHDLMEAQMTLSKRESQFLILETVIWATLGYFLLNSHFLQGLVLSRPLLTLVVVLIFNIFVGRYSGFRLLEYKRFKPIVDRSSS